MADLQQATTLSELERARALVLEAGDPDVAVRRLLDEFGAVGINAARTQTLSTLRRGRSPHTRDLLRVLDALDEALDVLDAAKTTT